MKTDKHFKENINFFRREEFLKYVGIVLMILSGVMYFWGWGYIAYYVMIIETSDISKFRTAQSASFAFVRKNECFP